MKPISLEKQNNDMKKDKLQRQKDEQILLIFSKNI